MKSLYKLRQSVERFFKTLKQSRRLNSHCQRGLARIALHCALSVLAFQMTALHTIRSGRPNCCAGWSSPFRRDTRRDPGEVLDERDSMSASRCVSSRKTRTSASSLARSNCQDVGAIAPPSGSSFEKSAHRDKCPHLFHEGAYCAREGPHRVRRIEGALLRAGSALFGLSGIAGLFEMIKLIAAFADDTPFLPSPSPGQILLYFVVAGILILISWGLWSVGVRRIARTGFEVGPFAALLVVLGVILAAIYALADFANRL